MVSSCIIDSGYILDDIPHYTQQCHPNYYLWSLNSPYVVGYSTIFPLNYGCLPIISPYLLFQTTNHQPDHHWLLVAYYILYTYKHHIISFYNDILNSTISNIWYPHVGEITIFVDIMQPFISRQNTQRFRRFLDFRVAHLSRCTGGMRCQDQPGWVSWIVGNTNRNVKGGFM